MTEPRPTQSDILTILARIDATAYALATICDTLRDSHPNARQDLANTLEATAKADTTEMRERPEAFLRLAEIIRKS